MPAPTRRALRQVLATVLHLPPAAIFESVRHVADLCGPDDERGARGAKMPSPKTVAWHLLAAMAAIPTASIRNHWPEGRAKGIRGRAENWADLKSIPSMVETTGQPPLLLRCLIAGNMPLGYTLELLLQELLKPEFIGLFGDGVAGDTTFGDDGIQLGLNGGHYHSFATLEFKLASGATLKATYRHPSDDGQREPVLTTRLGLGTRALAALAGCACGVVNVEEVARAAALPIIAHAPRRNIPGLDGYCPPQGVRPRVSRRRIYGESDADYAARMRRVLP